MITRPIRIAVVALVALTNACANSETSETPATADTLEVGATSPDVFTTAEPTISGTSTTPTIPTTIPTTATTTTTTTTSPAATTTTTTSTLPAATVADVLDLSVDSVVLGTSVQGRTITAERYGTSGGRRVLVIGVIHGNEDGGIPVLDQLRDRAIAGSLAPDVELWLVPSMNPDGQAAQDRHNANEVDLNRNFPLRWGPIGEPGDSQYAGPAPASEPETRAMVEFISELRPDLALWYHQDANLIIPSSGRDGRIRARYAELTGLPVADCCDGGVYTGIAATWARDELADQGSVAFIVELPGGELPADQVTVHADAVATIAAELPTL